MLLKILTLYKLGLKNLLWVAYYRLNLKLGLVTRNMDIKVPVTGAFFDGLIIAANPQLDRIVWQGFGWVDVDNSTPPKWNQALLSSAIADVNDLHWSKISDFSLNVGDIKTVWELSRFDWLLCFCVDYLKTGDAECIDKINTWLVDWSKCNPTNAGINWKCGQETSIRVMHLCVAVLLLKQEKTLNPSFIVFLKQHLERIEPTLLYAMAQDNNHGTSEATALYIGGLLLVESGEERLGKRYTSKGRYWLENRVKRLIEVDGSFSQYSVNYHRVMLDSYCLCEVFRKRFQQESFSNKLYARLEAATTWLYSFTQSENGDVPNIGANDGAKLIPLTDTHYRDYRPSVQLASALFLKEFKYPVDDKYHQVINLILGFDQKLGVNASLKSELFSDGGYAFLKNDNSSLYLRCPSFKFRPGQCDVLHLDFWLNGQNILRDGGSFSYNTDDKWLTYFSGVESHNTVQFDERNQMPKLSRFLYGNWLKTKILSSDFTNVSNQAITASYTDGWQAQHKRSINLESNKLIIIDDVSGFKQKAVLRWRLIPGDWVINGNTISNGVVSILIESNEVINRLVLTQGWESRYYLRKTQLPVLEVEINDPGNITTLIQWNN